MDHAWLLVLIAVGTALFYYVVKTAVRNGILEAHRELTRRIAAEEADVPRDDEVEK